jgi:DNA-binding transcriptional ArsR family regulator
MAGMSSGEGAKDRGREAPGGGTDGSGKADKAGRAGKSAKPGRPGQSGRPVGPVAEIRAEVRGALGEVRSALREVREATSSLSGLGALIGDVVRQVTDVDTIKALADPTRLAILRALMNDQSNGRRVMSAKELAEELAEPQTKLYRHLKVLADARLIEVAETRLVSGIVETRYRAAQTELRLDSYGMDLRDAEEEVIDVLTVSMDEYRDRFLANARRGGFPFAPTDTPEERRFGGAATVSARISPDQAREFHLRLNELLKEIESTPRDPDGVSVEVLMSWFAPERSPTPDS